MRPEQSLTKILQKLGLCSEALQQFQKLVKSQILGGSASDVTLAETYYKKNPDCYKKIVQGVQKLEIPFPVQLRYFRVLYKISPFKEDHSKQLTRWLDLSRAGRFISLEQLIPYHADLDYSAGYLVARITAVVQEKDRELFYSQCVFSQLLGNLKYTFVPGIAGRQELYNLLYYLLPSLSPEARANLSSRLPGVVKQAEDTYQVESKASHLQHDGTEYDNRLEQLKTNVQKLLWGLSAMNTHSQSTNTALSRYKISPSLQNIITSYVDWIGVLWCAQKRNQGDVTLSATSSAQRV
ncbi:MAG: hypothetical protein AAGF04_02520 [Chlamydiota bacterium]